MISPISPCPNTPDGYQRSVHPFAQLFPIGELNGNGEAVT